VAGGSPAAARFHGTSGAHARSHREGLPGEVAEPLHVGLTLAAPRCPGRADLARERPPGHERPRGLSRAERARGAERAGAERTRAGQACETAGSRGAGARRGDGRLEADARPKAPRGFSSSASASAAAGYRARQGRGARAGAADPVANGPAGPDSAGAGFITSGAPQGASTGHSLGAGGWNHHWIDAGRPVDSVRSHQAPDTRDHDGPSPHSAPSTGGDAPVRGDSAPRRAGSHGRARAGCRARGCGQGRPTRSRPTSS